MACGGGSGSWTSDAFGTLMSRSTLPGSSESYTALACPLGLVHRLVGSPKQVVDGGIATVGGSHADAGADGGRPLADGEGLADGVDQAAGEGDGVVGGRVEAQHEELVAAQAADGVRLAHGRGQTVGHRDERLVALQVAVGVVQLLEPVEVDGQQGERLAALAPG